MIFKDMKKICILFYVFAASMYGDLYDVYHNPLNWPPLLYAIHVDDDESAVYFMNLYPWNLNWTEKGSYDNCNNSYPPFSYHLGQTPLEMALRKGKVDLFKMMVEKGADINFKRIILPESFPGVGKLHTALSIALEEDNRELIVYLKEKGFDFNLCFATTYSTKDLSNWIKHTPKWKNVFEVASEEQLPFILEVVSGKQASQEAIDWFKQSRPLHKAFEEGNLEKAIMAFEYGADPYAEYPQTLFSMALENEDPAFLHLLIDHKLFLGDIYIKAIKENNYDLLNILFSKGLYAEGILLETIRLGDLEMVKLLVEQGFRDECALSEAITLKKYTIALFLYEQNFAFDPENYKLGRYVDSETREFLIINNFPMWIGHNDLISAIYEHNLKLLKLYYEKGYRFADIWSGFYCAVRENDTDILEFLFEKHTLSSEQIDRLVREALWIKTDKRILEILSEAY